MITKFVGAYMGGKEELRRIFSEKHPEEYKDIVRAVVEVISEAVLGDCPDPERIVEINHGGHQGVLVYVIGETGGYPTTYWYITIQYGSCSGCDALMKIRGYDEGKPTQEQVEDYMTLALHVVQSIKVMCD